MTRLRLGEILIQQGLITEDQLKQAMSAQAKQNGRLGEILIQLKIVDETNIITALAKQLNLPFVSLGSGLLKPQSQEILKLVSQEF